MHKRLLAIIFSWVCGFGWGGSAPTTKANPTASPGAYDVVWDSPSPDHNGSMPLGNGDIGLNAWIEPSGDLVFYIAKTDAWDGNGRLVKLGRVRISLDPTPEINPFMQRLRLREGTLEARFGEGADATELRLWVDANRPVIHVETQGQRDQTATAAIELWRTAPYPLASLQVSDLMEDRSRPGSLHQPVIIEPDTLLQGQTDRIGWFHHNRKSEGPGLIASIQGLADFPRADPLLHRTFGAVIQADGGQRIDDAHLRSPSSGRHRFSIHVVSRHPSGPDPWLRAVNREIATTEAESFDQRRRAHEQWWNEFWERSWIHVTADPQTPPTSLIPTNSHPVRIGVDQHGASRFTGSLGRMHILPRVLNPEDIQALARGPRDARIDPADARFAGTPIAGATLPDSEAWSFAEGMTIEAWIQAPNGGRIVDDITPGGSDGFLFDTHPGNSLRLIVGDQTLAHPNVLPEKDWVHVAATVDPATGRIALYLNGTELAGQQIAHGDDALVVSRAYSLQRYIDACAGRGSYPIKFNGSLFTVPEGGDPDYRRWGPGYWWQNTRLPYISMCTAGDNEFMRPLFRMYVTDLLPLHEYRTRLQTGSRGAFIPECIYFWGDQFTATYGWTPLAEREDKLQESGWHKREWVSGLELTFMMLDYYDHLLDETFLAETLLPAAHQFLTFFDEFYPTNQEGQLEMYPAMACETWWDCTNPMPELAGLHAVTARLLALPNHLTSTAQRAFWTSLQRKLPPLPVRSIGDAQAFAPATRFADKRNVENPELYAVFPFRLASFEKANAEQGRQALSHRWDRGNSGWRQDELFMAYLGLAEAARDSLVARARNKHGGSRFPAFWGPNYDWVPDQDHGGVLTRTLQVMLLQADPYSRKLFLLPAWPPGWDARFKLHAPYRTVIEGRVEKGTLVDLTVTPPSRRNDIIVSRGP